jgi:adenylate cyclase class 2
MQTEIEAKFLDIDHDAMRAKLRELGAVCEQPMRLMKRKVYDFPDGSLRKKKNGWARVRDEGDKITMSYKQLNDRSFQGTKEVDVTIDSFEAGCSLLEALGLAQRGYQETKRESWKLHGIEIELDEWPWTKPYVEIEGPDEQAVRDVADQLGLDWATALHGSVEVVYQAEYDVTEDEVNSWTEFLFTPVPEFLEARRR